MDKARSFPKGFHLVTAYYEGQLLVNLWQWD